MLTTAKTLKGYKLIDVDGDVGSIREFFFDDKYWTVRYLVANTGGWLNNRQVLISPYMVTGVDADSEVIHVELTQRQIEDSPSWDSDKPVSRQYEEDYSGYYGSPNYWRGPYMWGTTPYIVHDREKWSTANRDENVWDPNLRSTKDVTGHHIQATDDEIGHVYDFVIDDGTWTIRYIIVDTKKWLTGKKVLISPQWIERINWEDSEVAVNLSREAIEGSPEYDEDSMLTRDYETGLYRYYNRQDYWSEEPATREYSHHQ